MAWFFRRFLGLRSKQPPSPRVGTFSDRHYNSFVPSSSSHALSSSVRWSKAFDVCICHAEEDINYASDLVSFLELKPDPLRCFLQLRDSIPGNAISTELYQAVRNSHCWVLIITPSFLKDHWCRYQMQQALSESPGSNGRIIPVRKQLEHKDYPEELRFLYMINVQLDKKNGFEKIHSAVIYYLGELCQSEQAGHSPFSDSHSACSDVPPDVATVSNTFKSTSLT
uniref:Toll/interleukin-1 receptor domain-containing adapter protein n=1 Tax=Callorhinchus milii TaxID=7868 RepID=V9L8Z7_CALMI